MATTTIIVDKHILPRRQEICPRLTPTMPPPNFGAVKDGLIYRSAFPQPRNVDFLSRLKLKTILCLVDTENSEECVDFAIKGNINRIRIDIAANKDGNVKSTVESIYQALLVVMDVTNYPLLIHCNQGRHRTGCVVACFRKLQGLSLQDILVEYEAYSSPKARDGDKKLIQDVFQPEAMLDYVKNNVQFDRRPSLTQLLRSDLVNAKSLVDILATTDGMSGSHESLKSNVSSKADSGFELGIIIEEDANETPRPDEVVEISVEECEPMSP